MSTDRELEDGKKQESSGCLQMALVVVGIAVAATMFLPDSPQTEARMMVRAGEVSATTYTAARRTAIASDPVSGDLPDRYRETTHKLLVGLHRDLDELGVKTAAEALSAASDARWGEEALAKSRAILGYYLDRMDGIDPPPEATQVHGFIASTVEECSLVAEALRWYLASPTGTTVDLHKMEKHFILCDESLPKAIQLVAPPLLLPTVTPTPQ